MQALTIIVSITASIISGMVLFFLQRYMKKKDKKDDKRDRTLAEENILIIKSINAVGNLTVANAIALRDGKHNGEMGKALREYNSAEKSMYEYLLRQNSNKGRI